MEGPLDGAEIRRLRTSFDPPVTTTELAFRLKVSQRTVARWENEGTNVSFTDAMKLARLLGISVAKLMTEEFAAEVREMVPFAERRADRQPAELTAPA